MRDIVHAFKYEGRQSLARPLAAMMRSAAGDILRDADFVVPVPLHPWRRIRRGFNQASDLARGLGGPVLPALWRVHRTRQQMGLGAGARRQNMRHAFRLSPLCRTDLRGTIVVLVDDVRTTGATLDACAEVLMQAGVREVRSLTAAVARVPAKDR